MKVKELLAFLKEADPNADVITGFWNGFVDTYTLVDDVWGVEYDCLRGDLFGTPGAIDFNLTRSGAKNIVFIGSSFPMKENRVFQDRCVIWRLTSILDMHRSLKWKKDQLYIRLKRYLESASEDN